MKRAFRTSFHALLLLSGLTASSLSLAADAPGGKLVIYTSQAPEIAQQTIDAFKAAYPTVEVEWTRNGTTQLMNVLHTEMMSGQVKPDVLLVADAINLGALKKEGQLYAWQDAPVSQLNPAYYDADKTFFGTKIIATVIAYNTQRAKPVTSWKALAVAENKGQIAVPSPLYSGAALYKLHTDINTPSIGWEFYQQLAAIGIAPQGGNGPALKAVASGMDKYGVITDADIIRARKQGSPIDLVYPQEGVSYVTEPVAIMKSVHNLPAAKAFVTFMLSEAGQQLVAKQGNRPIDSRVAAPEGFAPIDQIKLLTPDVAKAVGDDAAVRETFTELFGG
ncbi:MULTISPECIES: ABC transporter substrate-binding protein [Pantoea]|jgi:iron(III) transport system substrate-binding protein|uniref:ABC transporter substrate-binding protein n=1 Tax=Pantoea brenneri TaxID=472694 RepID=A0A7Y6TTA9_9GAMM|nr:MULTISPECIES: ABC transporter substrate-binding protein [Pantoea]MBZ6395706.1 ABC transporter substrate-binding protein [Pantoea sp.]MBZ6439330.1 ABC transporter substrate-binding protein [Pantoea sp.]MDU7866376.1 ABC transporter substrate-binding protein [Pantoea sp.]NUY43154.1 ABC transporter substrate-binding protein [Pantoea brenneri]NUY50720.1 ABC transporter substrate-binding protein [Pantoea brenneri]